MEVDWIALSNSAYFDNCISLSLCQFDENSDLQGRGLQAEVLQSGSCKGDGRCSSGCAAAAVRVPGNIGQRHGVHHDPRLVLLT